MIQSRLLKTIAASGLLALAACTTEPTAQTNEQSAISAGDIRTSVARITADFDRYCEPLATGTSLAQATARLQSDGYSLRSTRRGISLEYGNFLNVRTYVAEGQPNQISLADGVASGQAFNDASGANLCAVTSNISNGTSGRDTTEAVHSALEAAQEANATAFSQATGQTLFRNMTLFGTDAAYGNRLVGTGKDRVVFTTQESPAALLLIDSF